MKTLLVAFSVVLFASQASAELLQLKDSTKIGQPYGKIMCVYIDGGLNEIWIQMDGEWCPYTIQR